MRMCQAFARLGHNVTLHVPRGEASTLDDHAYYGVERSFGIVKRRRFQVRVLGASAYTLALRYALGGGPLPDLFYARDKYSLAACVSLGVPFCFESHWRPKDVFNRELEHWLLSQRGCRRVVLISEALRTIYERQYPWFPRENLLVAHDAADLPSTGAEGPPLETGGRLQVGYVGSFFKGYGIELLPILAARRAAMDFHVFGGDPAAVASWRERSAALSNLTFHGFVTPSELGQRYRALDVLLAPYQRGTPHIEWISPMKLFEYMAYSKAIVCADHAVMREILEHEKSALLVPPEDVDAWCNALDRLTDPELRGTLGRNSFERVARCHTWENRARAVLAGLDVAPINH